MNTPILPNAKTLEDALNRLRDNPQQNPNFFQTLCDNVKIFFDKEKTLSHAALMMNIRKIANETLTKLQQERQRNESYTTWFTSFIITQKIPDEEDWLEKIITICNDIDKKFPPVGNFTSVSPSEFGSKLNNSDLACKHNSIF